ncbi:response regulator [Erythrobacter sp. JK5]|uniref:response regulator n=1 Tax=Erythrobacter sp. JK5 TaxID=2829500 RepID=UPI001BA4CF5F|nr:response regulator [Erythrobacter sp. JK5]QUL37901.1 response regulator [Erythrobacter sp. JK5]
MERTCTILVLEDEPVILMDLQLAAEDCGCIALTASTCEAALEVLHAQSGSIDAAVLDVSLGNGLTCLPVAKELDRQGIPYILHSGDLDRHNERIRELKAELISKPAAAATVISAALAHCHEP